MPSLVTISLQPISNHKERDQPRGTIPMRNSLEETLSPFLRPFEKRLTSLKTVASTAMCLSPVATLIGSLSLNWNTLKRMIKRNLSTMMRRRR